MLKTITLILAILCIGRGVYLAHHNRYPEATYWMVLALLNVVAYQ